MIAGTWLIYLDMGMAYYYYYYTHTLLLYSLKELGLTAC